MVPLRRLERPGRASGAIRDPREAAISRRSAADAQVRRQGRQGADNQRSGRQHPAFIGWFEEWIGQSSGGSRRTAVRQRECATGECGGCAVLERVSERVSAFVLDSALSRGSFVSSCSGGKLSG